MRTSLAANLILIALIAGAAYYYRSEVKVFAIQAVHQVAPCRTPVTYAIGSIDPRFGISTTTLERSLSAAEATWETAAGKPLFEAVPADGLVTVRLVYDARQATAQKLRELGLSVQDNAETYERVKTRYDAEYGAYAQKKQAFEATYAAYSARAAAYEAEVSQWNARGGAPEEAYQRLQAEKVRLDRDAAQIRQLERAANDAADSVNALAQELNRLADVLNLAVDHYNTVGGKGEFEEAVFVSSPGREEIIVYEYDSIARLTRVLAHEFGHSLGLEHVDDERAIMYRLNQSANETLTDADMQELARVCRGA